MLLPIALTVLHVQPPAQQTASFGPEMYEFDSLHDAYNWLVTAPDDDYDIVVHGGLYHEPRLFWEKTFPGRIIRVIGAEGEYPVFDGTGFDPSGDPQAYFVRVNALCGDDVGLHFEGLHIRNYTNAFWLSGVTYSGCAPFDPVTTSHTGVVIRNNVIERIGDIAWNFERCEEGYSAIQVDSSRDVLIENNVFRQITNCTCAANQLHAAYVNYDSDGAIIRNNFIEDASGDPFKFRYGSSDGLVAQNYVHRAYNDAPVQSYVIDTATGSLHEPRPTNIAVNDNLFLHPSETEHTADQPPLIARCWVNPRIDCDDTGGSYYETCSNFVVYSSWQPNRFVSAHPTSYEVTAATSADLDGDGQDELVIALKSGGVTRILRPKLLPHIMGEVIWATSTQQVLAMTAGDFDGNGRDELAIAVRRSDGRVQVTRSSGTSWAGNEDLGILYAPISGGATGVTAMAAGDFDPGDPGDELLTAFRFSTTPTTRIYRGDGVSATTGATGQYLSTNSIVQNLPVSAMTAADVDADGMTDTITAFANGWGTYVYVGDGIITAVSKRQLYASNTYSVTALSSGDVDGDGRADLLTTLRSSTSPQQHTVWRGDGWTPTTGLRGFTLGSGNTFTIPEIVAGDFREGGADELATVFRRSDAMQIWNGDGVSSLGTFWKFFDQAIGEYTRPEDGHICPSQQ